ncbi:hypothetical protein CLUG_01822 [Clavispora lusitaniae ATCC 42720]|uniref:DNA-directed RNA polymerase III subunit RPC9 n=3 Tax=Clavispora lusitaniae TaxID=36911 RepID=C4Y0U0_CLAL4|nr:uncharacterized protein CLUG_01822 [Clavispora lusitaniae ATCC 42720]EEQ37699.1 hypothetical protein CLUG_01822 [Clavispora lusitaniae ATCC 42720]
MIMSIQQCPPFYNLVSRYSVLEDCTKYINRAVRIHYTPKSARSHRRLSMKILTERDAFLSDFEVFQHLRDLKKTYNWTFTPEEEAQNNNKRKRFTAAGLDLEVVTRDITAYFSSNAAGSIPDEKAFTELMTFLNGFDLMKVEKLQIVNSLPRSMVHLYGLVEECDQRFDEETCESILAKINELMPVEADEEEEEEGEEEEAEE